MLHALLVLALMLNGTAIPAVATAAAAPDIAPHAQHHGHGGMQDQAPADVPTDVPAPDCCDGKTCGCGCTVPQATVLRPITVPRDWANPPAGTVLVNKFHVSGVIGAPFRPPA